MDGDHRYELNGDDSRIARDRRRVSGGGRTRSARSGATSLLIRASLTSVTCDEEGLMRFVALDGRERAVTLTERGHHLLEAHRRDRDETREQAFYAGVSRPRELSHDVQLYRAYLREEERLRDQGADIRRVVLEQELKREYQEWLQEPQSRPAGQRRTTRSRRPRDRTWAREHDLPYFDDRSTSPTSASSTSCTDATITRMSRWSPSTIAAPTPPAWRGRDSAAMDAAGAAGGAAGAVRSARGRGVPMMKPVSPRTVRQRQPGARQAPHAIWLHRASGAVSGPRAGLLRRVPRTAVPRVHRPRARPEDARLSRQARQRRVRHARSRPARCTAGGSITSSTSRSTRPSASRTTDIGSPPRSGRFVERLMLLDAVLADRRYGWLGTEQDKRTYFREACDRSCRDDWYPHLTFGTGRGENDAVLSRQAADWRAAQGRRRHVFLYLATREVPADFRVFLLRHADLLKWVDEWTIRVLLPRRFRKAAALYRYAVRDAFMMPLEPRDVEELDWYFRARRGELVCPSRRPGSATSRRPPEVRRGTVRSAVSPVATARR